MRQISKIQRFLTHGVLVGLLLGILAGCGSDGLLLAPTQVDLLQIRPDNRSREEVRVFREKADLERNWALVYYRSWRRGGDVRYLELSRQHMANAVSNYFNLQVSMGHSFPTFYDIDQVRLEGCGFLREVESQAQLYEIPLAPIAIEGCFYR